MVVVGLLGQLGVELLVVLAVHGEGLEQPVHRAQLEPRHLEHVLRAAESLSLSLSLSLEQPVHRAQLEPP